MKKEFHCQKCNEAIQIYKHGKKHRVLVCPKCGILATNPLATLPEEVALAPETGGLSLLPELPAVWDLLLGGLRSIGTATVIQELLHKPYPGVPDGNVQLSNTDTIRSSNGSTTSTSGSGSSSTSGQPSTGKRIKSSSQELSTLHSRKLSAIEQLAIFDAATKRRRGEHRIIRDKHTKLHNPKSSRLKGSWRQ
jgi:hypothetical protein